MDAARQAQWTRTSGLCRIFGMWALVGAIVLFATGRYATAQYVALASFVATALGYVCLALATTGRGPSGRWPQVAKAISYLGLAGIVAVGPSNRLAAVALAVVTNLPMAWVAIQSRKMTLDGSAR
jgi:hypothetical protein